MNFTVPGSSALHARQHFGHAHQDRDVVVVAAGVHHADLLAVVRRLRRRLERQVDLLGDRQRVHVGAQRHDLSGLAALEDADDAGLRDAGLHLEPERPKVLGDDLRRSDLAVAELGVLVDVAAPGDHFRHDGLYSRVDFSLQICARAVPAIRTVRPRATTIRLMVITPADYIAGAVAGLRGHERGRTPRIRRGDWHVPV